MITYQLKNGSDKLFELQQQLAKSQATVIELTEEDRNTFSGSDSYCYADIIAITKDKAMVTVTHVGKYPLSDIIIYMRPITKDMELAEHPELQTYQRMMELAMSNKRIVVGNLPAEPKNSRMVDEIPFNHLIPETYYLEFVAKNGSWAQICDFQYGKDGKTRYAYKVVRIEHKGDKRRETELKRYITPGYPIDGVINKELEKGFY